MRVAAAAFTMLAASVLGLAPGGGPVAANHLAPAEGAGITGLSWDGPAAGDVTFRSVAFAPDGTALLAGGTAATNTTAARQVLLHWGPDGIETVIDREGTPFTAVSVSPSGTALILGQRDQILLRGPDGERDLWAEAIERGTFETPTATGPFTFIGLDAAWSPDGSRALIAGSSLLSYTAANDTSQGPGPLRVVHGGAGAFFNVLAWDPSGHSALVAGGVEDDDSLVLGTLWLSSGLALSEDDAVAVYGVFAPTRALVNAIAYDAAGSAAMVAGRDGSGATYLAFDPVAYALDRQGQPMRFASYLPTYKAVGSITDLVWSAGGALVGVGRAQDTVLLSDGRAVVPLRHGGPDLFGVAWSPDGDQAIAAGAGGAIVRIRPPAGPYGAVVFPPAGSFATPETTVSVAGFAFPAERSVEGARVRVAGQDAWATARFDARAGLWNATVRTDGLADGTHAFEVELVDGAGGSAAFTHPFTISNARFTPAPPTDLSLGGLEGPGLDTDGAFSLSWTSGDTGVNFEIERSADGEVLGIERAGAAPPASVAADEDGSYSLRVRAVNRFFTGNWSEPVTVRVVLDRDGDGVPDVYDPDPFTPDVWGDRDGDGVADLVEQRQCSDPDSRASTPAADDDGDGFANGIECTTGYDPKDPASRPGAPPPPPPDGTGDGDDEEGGIPGPGLVGALVCALAAMARRRLRRA